MSLPKFTWKPRRTMQVTDRYRTLETAFDSGRKQYRSKGVRPRIFQLHFNKQNMHSDEPHEIIEFFKDRQGKLEPFLWDYVDERGKYIEDPEDPEQKIENIEELTVHFNQDILPREVFVDVLYSFTLEFIESLW